MIVGCSDHHKDRDCHWYIEKRWSYGNVPTYQAYHNGYVFEPESCKERATYKEAQHDLFELLKSGFKEQFDWAYRALKEPDQYDQDLAGHICNQYKKYKEIINAV